MTYIANQRIKRGGVFYAPGDPIELTGAELAELPDGAVSKAGDSVAEKTDKKSATGTPPQPSDADRLSAAVAALSEADFKKDGQIRADSLKALGEGLGFEVTAETVAEIMAAGTGGGNS